MLPKIELTENIDIFHFSPLLRGMKFAISYGDKEGGIGLTATGAMNRKFVHWAAVHFEWPEYGVEELYSVNKVLNELDFPPLGVVRDMNQLFRLMRRQRDKLLQTKNGRAFLAQPQIFFDRIAHTYLFNYIEVGETQHDVRERMQVWDFYLNTINALADEGFKLQTLKRELGILSVEDDPRDWRIDSELGINVLRPLCWLGLLRLETGGMRTWREQTFRRTPLWKACLKLATD